VDCQLQHLPSCYGLAEHLVDVASDRVVLASSYQLHWQSRRKFCSIMVRSSQKRWNQYGLDPWTLAA
jgi:hypothetical protein